MQQFAQAKHRKYLIRANVLNDYYVMRWKRDKKRSKCNCKIKLPLSQRSCAMYIEYQNQIINHWNIGSF